MLYNVNCIYQNEFKQGALVHFEELLVPHGNVICPLLLVLIILRRRRIIFVMSTPLNHLKEIHTHTHATLIKVTKFEWNPSALHLKLCTKGLYTKLKRLLFLCSITVHTVSLAFFKKFFWFT